MNHANGNGSASLAKALGWLSIGLGAMELFAPRQVSSALGMEGRERMIQACGAREVASGLAILMSRDQTPWVWGRVAGDALDLAALAPAFSQSNSRRGTVALAIGAVAAVTLLDIICARELSHKHHRRSPPRDYSDRSGFPQGVESARGIAAQQAGK